MKILQVSFLDPRSDLAQGVESVVKYLSQNLTSLNYDTTILYASDNESFEKTHLGKVYGLKIPRFEVFSGRGQNVIRKILYNIRVANFLKRYGDSFDIIHIHGDNGSLKYAKNLHSVLTLHGFGPLGEKHKNRLLKTLLRWILGRYELLGLKYATEVTVVSDRVRRLASSYTNRRMKVIYNGIDTSEYYPVSVEERALIRDKIFLNNDFLQILFMGKDPHVKGLDIAINSIDKFSTRTGKKVQLNIIGLKKYRNVRLESKRFVLNFLGPVYGKKKIRMIQGSDLFLSPSRGDAFSISVIEAMSCGIPTIVSEYAGITELLTHKRDSIIIRNNDVEAYASAIEQLFESETLYHSISINARKLAHELDWSKISKSYLDLYSDILHKLS